MNVIVDCLDEARIVTRDACRDRAIDVPHLLLDSGQTAPSIPIRERQGCLTAIGPACCVAPASRSLRACGDCADLVPGGFRVVVILVWVATAILAGVLLFLDPDSVRSEESAGANPLEQFFAPLWLRMLLITVIALLAVSATAIAGLRASLGGRGRRRVSLFECVLAVSLGFPAFAMAADQQFLLASIALLMLIGVEWFAHTRAVTSRAPRWLPAVAGAVALPWLVVLVAQPLDAVGSGGWTWAAIFWFAATFAVFGAYYGIVRASAARARRVRFTKRSDMRPGIAWACIAVVAVLILARFTVARSLFNESDALLWAPWAKAPMSWVLAALIASVIAFAAIRSSANPFRQYGERLVSGVIAGAGEVLELVLSWFAVIVGMTVAIFTGSKEVSTASSIGTTCRNYFCCVRWSESSACPGSIARGDERSGG